MAKRQKSEQAPVEDEFVPEPPEEHWLAYLTEVGIPISDVREPDGDPRRGYFANSNRRYCRDIWMKGRVSVKKAVDRVIPHSG